MTQTMTKENMQDKIKQLYDCNLVTQIKNLWLSRFVRQTICKRIFCIGRSTHTLVISLLTIRSSTTQRGFSSVPPKMSPEVNRRERVVT